MGDATTTPREAPPASGPPLLVDARAAAALCGVSESFWWRLHSSGRVPMPVKLGRATRWFTAELAAWCAAGAPSRDRWQAVKEAGHAAR